MLSNSPSLFIIPGGTPGGCGFFISAQSLSLAGIFSVKHVPRCNSAPHWHKKNWKREEWRTDTSQVAVLCQYLSRVSYTANTHYRTNWSTVTSQYPLSFSAQSPDKNLQKHIPVQRADLRATGFPEDGTWETASKRLPNGPHPLLETNSSRFHRPSELTEYTVHIPYRNRKLVVLVRWTTIEESPHQSTFQCL